LATACSTTSVEPLYGAPPVVDSGSDDAANDAPSIVDAAYGGPPIDAPATHYGAPPDAGFDAGGSDAANDAPSIVDAAYGGPPIDAGSD
jgi:hypothetical protein